MDGIISGKIEKNPDAINFVPDDNYVFEKHGSAIYEALIKVPNSFDYQSDKWYLKVIEISGQISLLHAKYITRYSPFNPTIMTNSGKCAFYIAFQSDYPTAIHATMSSSSVDIMTVIQNVQLGTIS